MVGERKGMEEMYLNYKNKNTYILTQNAHILNTISDKYKVLC